jgi:WD40 repeat protein
MPPGMVLRTQFSPDGQLIAAGGMDDKTTVWELTTRKKIAGFFVWRAQWPGKTLGPAASFD